jgi:hypothetical protein
MSDKETSDLSLSRVECEKCGAIWINGKHYWGTGAVGNEKDLAGLVCQNHGNEQCINPQKDAEGGDTWEKRLGDITQMLEDKMNQ